MPAPDILVPGLSREDTRHLTDDYWVATRHGFQAPSVVTSCCPTCGAVRLEPGADRHRCGPAGLQVGRPGVAHRRNPRRIRTARVTPGV